jgi:hypothetical protein
LNGADEFNGIQRPGSTQLNTVQHQPSMQPKSADEVAAMTPGNERLKVEK